MEDPEAIILPTIQRNSTSEGKALADPPGWAVPVNHARHLEWWGYQESDHQQQHEPAIPVESSKTQNDPAIPVIPTSQPLHRYDDYVKANNNTNNEDDAFSWVPPPPVGAPNRSPDGWALTFRTLEAKRIYESAVPQRSWSVDSDKNEPVHGEQTVITDYTHNSWIMERQNPLPPPTSTSQPSAESIAKETQSQTQEGYEEEIVVEEIIDEETATGTMEEEEVIDEEIVDEEFQDEEEEISVESSENDHGDLEEFVDEEILEQVMSASESDSHSCSTFSSKSLPQNPPTSTSQEAAPSKPSSSSSFLPPKSSKKAKTGGPNKVPNSTKVKKSTPPPRNRSQRAPDSVASSTHNSDSLPSRKKPISQSSSSSSSQTSSRKTEKKDESSSVDEITEDSGSTQIIYIRDPHDLEEIVQKCFNGNVRVEDEMTPTIDDDYFVPSKYQLALLTVLIIVVGMVIIVGLIVYFR